MEMPAIESCAINACAYNRDGKCHALAITVGNSRHAHCDTYFRTSSEGGDPAAVGLVGACKMADCRHNVRLACQAPEITVGYVQSEVDCLTYAPR